jgi:hypothetical protein
MRASLTFSTFALLVFLATVPSAARPLFFSIASVKVVNFLDPKDAIIPSSGTPSPQILIALYSQVDLREVSRDNGVLIRSDAHTCTPTDTSRANEPRIRILSSYISDEYGPLDLTERGQSGRRDSENHYDYHVYLRLSWSGDALNKYDLQKSPESICIKIYGVYNFLTNPVRTELSKVGFARRSFESNTLFISREQLIQALVGYSGSHLGGAKKNTGTAN